MRLGDREPNSIASFVIANADSLKNCDKTQYYLAIEKLNTKHQKKKEQMSADAERDTDKNHFFCYSSTSLLLSLAFVVRSIFV